MNRYASQAGRILLITLLGTVGAVVLGLLRYGSEVFQPASPGFAFVSFGFSGALIFAFYHVLGLSESITAAVLASAVQLLVGLSSMPRLQAAVFSFGLNLPVVLVAYLFERKLGALRAWRFVVVALTYGAMFVLLTLLVGVLGEELTIPPTTFQENFIDGLLLGLGLGLAVEAGEAILRPVEAGRPGGKHV